MKNYWSCSKFADWLRGTPKLPSGTSEEWSAWEKKAKSKKLRYWLAEEGLDYLEGFLCWPANRISDIRCYINNRWIKKSHALTSNLKRGQWHEFDTRLLHAVFDELVNFVEIELAQMLVVSSVEERKKYKIQRHQIFFRISVWRIPEAGIDYLKWASDLKIEDHVDKNDPSYGQPTRQALAAQETLKLYKWWKEERPKRPDPHEISGLRKYYEEKRKGFTTGDIDSWCSFISNKNNVKDENFDNILNFCHQMEKEQEEEDTTMLIHLIRIRQSLWT